MIKSNIKKEFDCNKEELWNIITNNNEYSWRSDLSKIQIVDDNNFIEYTKSNYSTYFHIISKKKLEEYKFSLENTNIKGEWTGKFKQLENGNIEVEFIEKIECNRLLMNILAKVYLKNKQQKYIKDLERKIYKK